MLKNISNLGDAALYCDFGKDVNKDTNTKVIRYFKSIQKKNILGINNLFGCFFILCGVLLSQLLPLMKKTV